jgi:hypothetical protein
MLLDATAHTNCPRRGRVCVSSKRDSEEGEQTANRRQDLEFRYSGTYWPNLAVLYFRCCDLIWAAYSVGIVSGTSIDLRSKTRSFADPQRVVSGWGWNIVGVIGLAIEGLVAFLSLAFVGLMMLAFLVIRAKQLGKLARRVAEPRAAP